MKRQDLEKRTVAELRDLAKAAGLSGASRMRKAQLIDELAGASRKTSGRGAGAGKQASKVTGRAKSPAKAAGSKSAKGKTGGGKPAPKTAAKKTGRGKSASKSAAKKTAGGTKSPRKTRAAKKVASKKPPTKRAKTKAATAKRESRKTDGGESSRAAVSPWVKKTFTRAAGNGEQRAKVSKYYLGAPETAEFEERFEYPDNYGENVISLMVRDPYWLFTYWEFAPGLRSDLAAQIGEEALLRSRTVLRVYDVTDSDPDRTAGHYDIDIASEARNWYINVARVEREYCVDIGIIAPDGSFITIARSNRVELPPVGPSDDVDEEWVAIDALRDLYVRVDRHRGGPTSGSGGWGSGGFGK